MSLKRKFFLFCFNILVCYKCFKWCDIGFFVFWVNDVIGEVGILMKRSNFLRRFYWKIKDIFLVRILLWEYGIMYVWSDEGDFGIFLDKKVVYMCYEMWFIKIVMYFCLVFLFL